MRQARDATAANDYSSSRDAATVAFLNLSLLDTIRFSTATDVSLMSLVRCWVRPIRMENMTSAGIAVMRPNAVQFIASEMPAARIVALSAGFTFATASKQLIRPDTVPRRPESIAAL